MFGVFDSSSLPINVIILVTKAYLLLCARRIERIHILALKNILQKQFELESNIAQKHPQTANFYKNWGVWINLFDWSRVVKSCIFPGVIYNDVRKVL